MAITRCQYVIREGGRTRKVVADGRLMHYTSLHKTLRRKYRKPRMCWSCGIEAKLQWALRSGSQYSHSISAFWPLCVKCHRRLDAGHPLPTWLGMRP
jgi:hypothetical protein